MAQREKDAEPIIFKRLSEMLHLRTINDLKRESLVILDMVISSDGIPEECFELFEAVSYIWRKIKDCVVNDNPEEDDDANESEKTLIKHRVPIIPDDFRCPISLELMNDPVILSTGQTYERSCIQKWLDAGHKICPMTQQTLLHTALTPNYVLKSLIAMWCESNVFELPKNYQGKCSELHIASTGKCSSSSYSTPKNDTFQTQVLEGQRQILAGINTLNIKFQSLDRRFTRSDETLNRIEEAQRQAAEDQIRAFCPMYAYFDLHAPCLLQYNTHLDMTPLIGVILVDRAVAEEDMSAMEEEVIMVITTMSTRDSASIKRGKITLGTRFT
ncbi:unnamed protein product [Cuscuta epithymum]|nr:unnamed protein product [Cuscuta epithymum]